MQCQWPSLQRHDRDAHGLFGGLRVVLAIGAAACTVAGILGRGWRRTTRCATALLCTLAAGSITTALAVIPDLFPSPNSTERTLGGTSGLVPYPDLVANQHAVGYWVSLPLVFVGLAGAVFQVLIRCRG